MKYAQLIVWFEANINKLQSKIFISDAKLLAWLGGQGNVARLAAETQLKKSLSLC